MSLKLYTKLAVVDNFFTSAASVFFILILLEFVSISSVGILIAFSQVMALILMVPVNWLVDQIKGRQYFLALANFGAIYMLYQYALLLSGRPMTLEIPFLYSLVGTITQFLGINSSLIFQKLAFLATVEGVLFAFGSLSQPLLADLTKGSEKGKKVGFFTMAAGVAGAAGIATGGYIIDALGFVELLYILMAVTFVSAIGMLFVNPSKEK